MPLLTMEQGLFRSNYNRRPFVVQHGLADHPLAQLDALRALALRLPKEKVLYRVRAKVNDDFDDARKDHPACSSAGEVFDRIHEPGSAVQISHPEIDSQYRPLVGELLANIRRYTESVDPTMTYTATYFFVAGPGCVTPYHMDREMNFLLHVSGPKTITLWDPADLDIMSERDRERLFSEPWRPGYRPEFEAKAMRFDLQPNMGIHHPFIAPHTANTGDAPSVSMAVTFRTSGSDRLRLLYRTNYRLRKLRLRPTPVGVNRGIDEVKAAVVSALRTIRPRAGGPSGMTAG